MERMGRTRITAMMSMRTTLFTSPRPLAGVVARTLLP